MRKHVRLILIGVAMMAMVIGLWPKQDMRSLPDGTLIRLYATTFGTNHQVSLGTPLRSNLRAVLPTRLARKIRPPIVGRVFTTNDSLAVWFKADVDPSHTDRRFNLGSKYECTLVDEQGIRLAADSLNEAVGATLHGDGTRLFYAVFPVVTNVSLTLCIQERSANSDGSITFQHPAPATAGLSGAYLKTNGMVRLAVLNHGG